MTGALAEASTSLSRGQHDESSYSRSRQAAKAAARQRTALAGGPAQVAPTALPPPRRRSVTGSERWEEAAEPATTCRRASMPLSVALAGDGRQASSPRKAVVARRYAHRIEDYPSVRTDSHFEPGAVCRRSVENVDTGKITVVVPSRASASDAEEGLSDLVLSSPASSSASPIKVAPSPRGERASVLLGDEHQSSPRSPRPWECSPRSASDAKRRASVHV